MAILETLRFGLTRWTSERDQFTRVQLDDSHENIERLVSSITSGTSAPSLPDSAYVRAMFYNTSSGSLYFSPDGVSWEIITQNIDPVTLSTIQTLTNKTFTSPTISSITNSGGGILTLPSSSDTLIGKDTTDTLENKTFSEATFNNPTLESVAEKWSIVASAPAGSQNINAETASAWYFSTNTTTNFSLNFRVNLSTPMSAVLKESKSITFLIAVKNGSSAHYLSSILVDGTSQLVKWEGGSPPTAGNANSTDIYLITIHRKSGTTPSYSVFGQVNQFS